MEIVTNNAFKGEGTLKLKGKNYKVKLTLNTFRMLTAKFGVQLDAFGEAVTKDPLTTIGQLTYCGLLSGSIAGGRKFEMDFDTFCDVFFEDAEGFAYIQELLDKANGNVSSKEEIEEAGN